MTNNLVSKPNSIDFFKPKVYPMQSNDIIMKMRDSLIIKVQDNLKKDSYAQ